jgi:hypothetical protein
LITRDSKSLQVENSFSFLSTTPFPVILKKGWNMIGLPFAFTVSWSSIDASVIQGKQLWYFTGVSWEPDSVMQPYRGYAVNAVTDTILHIPAQEAAPEPIPKPLQDSEWSLQVKVQKGDYRDFYNFAGTQPDAMDEKDPSDISEPPVIGKFVSACFIPHETGTKPVRLAGDFRSPEHEIYIFNLRLTSNLSGQAILSFLPRNIPDHYDWIIISTHANVRYPKERFTTEVNEETYRIVIGAKTALQPLLQEYREIPGEFELSQNYPNPFNPGTTIAYQLPEPTWLRIEIYDILGKKVRTLKSLTRQEAGYYTIVWDGRNNGASPVASAVYILVLHSEKFQRSIKMVIQR